MADKKFSVQVNDIITMTEKRMNALIRQSTQEVIDLAQTPGPSVASTSAAIASQSGKRQGPVAAPGKGGKMPVDTGFLRASGQLSLNGMPTGPTRGNADGSYQYDANSTELKLAKAKIGDTIFFGWTAEYAQYMEARYGFLASAVQKWPAIVERVAAEIVARIKS